MDIWVSETIGTFILVAFGDGVVAGVLLRRSKAENGGWLLICVAWGLAVAMAVYAVGQYSGAHINAAVTTGLAIAGVTEWKDVPQYYAGEFLGAFLGAVAVYVAYYAHWKDTSDPGAKLAVFCTGPAVRNYVANLLSEIIATFMLVTGVLYLIATPEAGAGTALFPLIVGLLVAVIGMGFGGPTGFAINPNRDLGPRIAHFVLPIPGKGGSDWAYAWIPVVGPLVGGTLAAWTFNWLFPPIA